MSVIQIFIIKLLFVLLVGGIIGVERELKSKSAGFRTIMLICVGSFLFTTFSQIISPTTPDRIASNIVTGIGFLGAGVIFKDKNRVNGLTTAATIWVTAALGMGIASGSFVFVIVSTVVIFLSLFVMMKMELWIDNESVYKNYTITLINRYSLVEMIELKLIEYKLSSKRVRISKNLDYLEVCWNIKGKKSNHDLFLMYLMNESTISKFEV